MPETTDRTPNRLTARGEPAGSTPPAVADAAHYALVLTALRQAANAPSDGRGAAVRAVQRGRDLADTLAAATAQVVGEYGTAGTPGELLAESHLRTVVHHTSEYLRASATAAAEIGEDPDEAASRSRRMLLHFAQHCEIPGAMR